MKFSGLHARMCQSNLIQALQVAYTVIVSCFLNCFVFATINHSTPVQVMAGPLNTTTKHLSNVILRALLNFSCKSNNTWFSPLN